MALILPEHYDPHLDVRKTQEAIKIYPRYFPEGIWKRDESGAYFSTSFCIKGEWTE